MAVRAVSAHDAAQPVARVLLSLPEAAAACGVSLRFFREQIMPDVKRVVRGRRVLVPVKELERWAEENGSLIG